MRRSALLVAQAALLVLFVWLWQEASSSGRISAFDFGMPSEIWATLRDWWDDGTLWRAGARSTLQVLLLGWGIGTLIGVTVGSLIGLSSLMREILEPFLAFINGMPRLILQPFLIIWLGFGLAPKVVLVVLAIWIMTTLAVAQGYASIPHELVANARLLGASRSRLARDVYAPSLALWIISSSRSTFGFALQAAIVAEFIGTNEGLGHLIVVAQNGFKVNAIYAALAVVMAISLIGNALLSLAEARATRWMPESAR